MAEREISALINCIEHPKLLLNYFCPGHDTVFCENCRTEIHKTCHGLKTIKDACKNNENKQSMHELIERISEAKEVLSLTTDTLEDNITVLTKQYSNIKENIQNARKSFSDYLDSLESDLKQLVHDRCIKSVEERLVELERRKYTLEQWDDEVQTAVRSEDDEILFSTLKILHTLQNDMDSYLSDMQDVVKVTNVRWTPIRTDISSVAAFIGTLSLTERSSCIKLLESPRSARPNLVRESSVASHLSVGTVNIVPENLTNQGLNGSSVRTKEGWNEVSSRVQDDEVENVVTEEDSTNTKTDTINNRVANLNGFVDATINNSLKENDDKVSEESHVIEKNDEKDITDTLVDKNHEINVSKTHSDEDKLNHTYTSFPMTTKRAEMYVPKSKFEAVELDEKIGCEVHKSLFLGQSGLMFLDKQSKQIFICNKEGTVIHKIVLVHSPQDVSMLDEGRVVVTLGHVGIQLVNIKTCKREKHHDVGGFCSAVTAYKSQVILSVDSKLRLIDRFGYTLRRIQHEGCAHFVTTDNNGRIYYSDSLNHMVYCIAWYGIPVFIYSSRELRYPMGIVAEPSGFLYIAGFESNNVIKLWPNGRFHSAFLSEKDKMYEPTNLDYNQNTGEILVIRDSNQNIEVYDINNSSRNQK